MVGARAPVVCLSKDPLSIVQAPVQSTGITQELAGLGAAPPAGRVECAAIVATPASEALIAQRQS